MATKGKVNSNENRRKLIERHRAQRAELRAKSKNMRLTEEERVAARAKLAALPRNSAEVRYRNRCQVSGRPRGVLSKFQLSRIKFREYALAGQIPGVIKSSW